MRGVTVGEDGPRATKYSSSWGAGLSVCASTTSSPV